jgi:hypothetical protein
MLIAVLHHVADPEMMLREARRVSARTIIFDYVASDHPMVAFVERLWIRVQDGDGRIHFDENAWRQIIGLLGGVPRVIALPTNIRFFMAAVVDWKPRPG